MPRYSSLQVTNVSVRNNSIPPISSTDLPQNFNNLPKYENLSNDLKVGWDGDLEIDTKTGDFALAFQIEAYVQNLYHRLITQIGRLPGDSTYGWDFEYIYSLNILQQKQLLPVMINDISAAVSNDPDTLIVHDVTGRIVYNPDNFTHNLEFELIVTPKGINNSTVTVILSNNTTGVKL